MELLKPIKINKKIRKNGFEDTFFVIIILFAIVIFLLILAKTWGDIKTPLDEGLSGAMPDDSSVNVTQTLDGITSATLLFDSLLPFLIIGLFAFVFLGAAAYLQHPVMIFVGIIILAVTILLAVVYANVYHQIAETDEFASTTADFAISNLFMKYLPIIVILLFIGIMAIVIFFKQSGGGGL